MSFRTVDGTATTGDSDYIAKTGTLTFAPGETTKTITIEVKGDSKKEANETFYLDLFGNSGNSLFTKNRGIGTILNDDGPAKYGQKKGKSGRVAEECSPRGGKAVGKPISCVPCSMTWSLAESRSLRESRSSGGRPGVETHGSGRGKVSGTDFKLNQVLRRTHGWPGQYFVVRVPRSDERPQSGLPINQTAQR